MTRGRYTNGAEWFGLSIAGTYDAFCPPENVLPKGLKLITFMYHLEAGAAGLAVEVSSGGERKETAAVWWWDHNEVGYARKCANSIMEVLRRAHVAATRGQEPSMFLDEVSVPPEASDAGRD